MIYPEKVNLENAFTCLKGVFKFIHKSGDCDICIFMKHLFSSNLLEIHTPKIPQSFNKLSLYNFGRVKSIVILSIIINKLIENKNNRFEILYILVKFLMNKNAERRINAQTNNCTETVFDAYKYRFDW